MTSWIDRAERLVSDHHAVVRVTLVEATGPTPREVGAGALVTSASCEGRIGRGELQTAVIDLARRMLEQAPPSHPDEPPRWVRETATCPTGPVLGERSGGTKTLLFELMSVAELRALTAGAASPSQHEARRIAPALDRPLVSHIDAPVDPSITDDFTLLRPLASGGPALLLRSHTKVPDLPGPAAEAVAALRSVGLSTALSGDARTGLASRWLAERLSAPAVPFYVYGTGLLARALVRVLSGLPFEVVWVDEDPGRFPASPPAHVTLLASDDQPGLARTAPAGAFHAVMSISHDLDFAIVRAALEAGNFGYLGVIGSRMKRKRLHAQLAESSIPADRLARLACPIGLPGISSKTPAVIAVSIAAQALQTLQVQQPGPVILRARPGPHPAGSKR